MVIRTTILTLVTPLVLVACGSPSPEIDTNTHAESTEAAVQAAAQRDPRLALFAVLPEQMVDDSNPVTDAKVDLGRKLYYDKRLSKNHDVACNTCHLLDAFGVDGDPTSTGHRQQLGGRNAPTVYNAAGHIAQFWDGRSPSIEDQAKGPPLNPIEMAMPDGGAVEAVLRSIPGYVELFAAAFPEEAEPVSYDNMANAIGAFERGLVTPSRFDDYLTGVDDALTAAEFEGLTAFLDAGCATCHSGAYIGGAMYMKVGLIQPWTADADQGRFDITGSEADRQVFKVPSLRNIEHTGPYFHTGAVESLEEAVSLMAQHQIAAEVTADQLAAIVTFLGALTGEVDAAYIAEPELPASGPDTPAPDPS